MRYSLIWWLVVLSRESSPDPLARREISVRIGDTRVTIL